MASASSTWAWPERSKLQENTEQAPGEHRASSRKTQRRIEEGKHLLDVQEIPPWHGEAVPARPRWHQAREVADDMSAYHLTRQAPDLTKDRAKQLEIKLKVTMAEI
jgi:hypothetical protein